MGKILIVLFCILLSNLAASSAQSCGNYTFSSNAIYATCVSLPVLNSHLHWNYHPSNGTVDLAFRYTGSDTSQWITWALNVRRRGMIGSQSLVAVTGSNGAVQAYTASVNSYDTSLQQSALSFGVPKITAERVNGVVVIYATVVLPSGGTSFNQLWQVGPVSNGVPSAHSMGSANRKAVGVVDFSSGAATTGGGGGGDGDGDGDDSGVVGGGGVGGSRLSQKNRHGVLNAVSWGVLMPMGAMAARYLKVFTVANPAWFYIHVATQTSAYVVGVAGWATGLKLGSDSAGIDYDTHRNIGFILFFFGTLQVFALLLRPKPDNKYRFYWNIYHHSLGYSIIILSIINVYEGLDILDPEKKWKNAYTGILVILGIITVILEALTWFIVLKRKKEDNRTYGGTNGHA
ncbi:hypothetical protein R6Q59_019166 [Mikania micrantha]|uniref:Cytochrome b561 and DOMON domain-containing protein n=1 Tax=Mikania micrantha TaxID=192012 RepID=A0A5N6LYJ4_9ASTR|nr:hypothetical protein E3N88_34491 [Mikania micrantha]